MSTYAVPIGPGTNVTVAGEFPLTEQEWAQMMAVLNAMKPGLLKSEEVGSGADCAP